MWMLRFQVAATAAIFSCAARDGKDGLFVFAQTDTVVSTYCSISDMVAYEYKVEPEPGLSLYWSLSQYDISLKAVSVDFEVGWLSIGFSADGDMIGSDVVVGSVQEEQVLEYELGAKALPVQPPSSPVEGSIRLFSDEEQEITAGAFEQVNNVTSLSFTRPMAPLVDGKNDLPGGVNTTAILLWAAGPDDAFGYHYLGRGAFSVDLVCSGAPLPVDEDESGSEEEPGSEFLVTEAGIVGRPTEAPSASPEMLVFSASPSVAPVSPLTPQPVDGSTSGASSSKAGNYFEGALTLVLFAGGVVAASNVL